MEQTATMIKDNLAEFRGHAALYRLDPPLSYTDYLRDESGFVSDVGSEPSPISTEYVVVSAVNVWGSGPETYIFPAQEDGQIASWSEQEGSFKGELDHARALRGAGYTIITRED